MSPLPVSSTTVVSRQLEWAAPLLLQLRENSKQAMDKRNVLFIVIVLLVAIIGVAESGKIAAAAGLRSADDFPPSIECIGQVLRDAAGSNGLGEMPCFLID